MTEYNEEFEIAKAYALADYAVFRNTIVNAALDEGSPPEDIMDMMDVYGEILEATFMHGFGSALNFVGERESEE